MQISDTLAALRPNRPLGRVLDNETSRDLALLLTGGGDARIRLDSATGLNRYFSAPYPRDVLAYSSSTISDISADAFDHLLACLPRLEELSYADALNSFRSRLAHALNIPQGRAQIVFAPSGTDLEYVALACVLGRSSGGVHNILLGADETGSGCIHSAHGRYFAKETATGSKCDPAETVPGCRPVSLVDVKVRCDRGDARTSEQITADIRREINSALRRGAHPLVHCVHGSKTGLVLPAMSDIDALLADYGDTFTLVVDACQARITTPAIEKYLDRGAIILMTGSKFIGAPPFNGWAIVPAHISGKAHCLPDGFATIFRSAEWPDCWPGRNALPSTSNLSLALRLEAAIFELERFQQIEMQKLTAMIDAFERALEEHVIAPLAIRRVLPSAGGSKVECPIEMRTLLTLDMTQLPSLSTIEDAQAIHRSLAFDGIRLGQPVKCVRKADGWGGTLRIGLSMPQLIRWAGLPLTECKAQLAHDMSRIANAISQQVALIQR